MMRVRLVVAVAVALVVVSVAVAAGAAVTTVDASGVLVDGHKMFPVVLAKGPPPDATTPSGGNAFAEVVAAGVNFLKVGPATVPWTAADIDEAKFEDQVAAAHGAYTWVNLATVSRATPGSAADVLLSQVVTALEQDPERLGDRHVERRGRAMVERNRTHGTAVRLLPGHGARRRELVRRRVSARPGSPVGDGPGTARNIRRPRSVRGGQRCARRRRISGHGGQSDTRPARGRKLDEHDRGCDAVDAVWTTLQICASGSVRADGSFVLPTREQERFMIYDAIINGARNLAFYGGNNPDCWNATHAQHSWSWTFWNTTLRSLITEIGSSSPLAPALVNPASNTVLSTSDTTTEVVRRAGNSGELWVLAARAAREHKQ